MIDGGPPPGRAVRGYDSWWRDLVGHAYCKKKEKADKLSRRLRRLDKMDDAYSRTLTYLLLTPPLTNAQHHKLVVNPCILSVRHDKPSLQNNGANGLGWVGNETKKKTGGKEVRKWKA